MAERVSFNNPDYSNNSIAGTEKKDDTSDLETHHENLTNGVGASDEDRKFYEKYGTYDRYEITEEDCYDELGFSFPKWKKWMILSVVFLVQVSMNFNTSLYSNAIGGISEEYGVSEQVARLGAAIFLITYAFGCELWAVCTSSRSHFRSSGPSRSFKPTLYHSNPPRYNAFPNGRS